MILDEVYYMTVTAPKLEIDELLKFEQRQCKAPIEVEAPPPVRVR